jgi:hypothetical protein
MITLDVVVPLPNLSVQATEVGAKLVVSANASSSITLTETMFLMQSKARENTEHVRTSNYSPRSQSIIVLSYANIMCPRELLAQSIIANSLSTDILTPVCSPSPMGRMGIGRHWKDLPGFAPARKLYCGRSWSPRLNRKKSGCGMNFLLQLFQISLVSWNHYYNPRKCRISRRSFVDSSSSPQTCGNPCKGLKDGYWLLQISGPVSNTAGDTARDAQLRNSRCHLAPLHLSCSHIYSMRMKRSRFILG